MQMDCTLLFAISHFPWLGVNEGPVWHLEDLVVGLGGLEMCERMPVGAQVEGGC